MTKPSLSLVLPTYNEKENIKILIPLLENRFADIPHEIIVVDDSSRDGTTEEVTNLARQFSGVRLCSRKEKTGIGSALRYGYNQARHDVIMSCDADLSFAPDDLLKLYKKIYEGYDVVIGSRHSRASFYEKQRPVIALKYAVSWLGNALLRNVFRLPVNDFSVNCRAIRRSVWQALDTKENTNFFLFEMIWCARQRGFRITEVPVAFMDRKYGNSKINHLVEIPKAFYKMIIFLFEKKYRRP